MQPQRVCVVAKEHWDRKKRSFCVVRAFFGGYGFALVAPAQTDGRSIAFWHFAFSTIRIFEFTNSLFQFLFSW
jgi:hypothetical protein